MSFNCHKISISSQFFLFLISENKGRKKNTFYKQSTEPMLCSNCHLGPFPTSTQKLECVIITGRVCYHSAPTCLSTEPSQFPLAFCTTVLMEPKAVSKTKHYYCCSHRVTTASQLQINPPFWHANMHRLGFPLITHYRFIGLLYIIRTFSLFVEPLL